MRRRFFSPPIAFTACLTILSGDCAKEKEAGAIRHSANEVNRILRFTSRFLKRNLIERFPLFGASRPYLALFGLLGWIIVHRIGFLSVENVRQLEGGECCTATPVITNESVSKVAKKLRRRALGQTVLKARGWVC